MHHVYHLVEDGVVKYVGRTVRPFVRHRDHERNSGRKFELRIALSTEDFTEAARREVEDIFNLNPEFNISVQSSKGRMGIPHTEETKAKIGAANAGKVRSEETRQKLREANLGKTTPQEVRDKIAAGNRGKKMSPEAVAKTRAARLGYIPSEATVAKLKAAWIRRKAK